MGVAHVGLVHRDPYECKVKGFHAVSSIERNISKRYLQRMRQPWPHLIALQPQFFVLSFAMIPP